MIKDKETFLLQLAELPQLSDNIMAFVFAANPDLNISSREKFFDTVISYYNEYKKNPDTHVYLISEGDDVNINTWLNKDLRIKSIQLKSVRGFPESSSPFGLDFTNEAGEPQSMIILGGNASGKSSIYDAIEYSYCNSIGEALLRAYKQGSNDETKFKDYLRHFDNSESSIYCKIETVSDTLDIQKENIPEIVRKKINPDTHFISDFDIYTKGQLDYEKNNERSFHNTIAESLGLNELLEFEKNLKAFTLYRRQTESRNISALRKSNENQQKLIENNQNAINERKLNLEKLKEEQKINPDENNLKELLEKINYLKNSNISFSFDAFQLSFNITNFNKSYNNYISKEIKNGGQNEMQFLNLGLELLKEHDDCPFCQNSELLSEEIKKNVNDRIIRIRELNESTQELNKNFNYVVDTLLNLKYQIDLIKSNILKEIALIQDKVEFNELTQEENKFITELTELMSQDIFIEVSRLEENLNYQKDRNKFIFELLKKNKEYLESILSVKTGEISIFQKNRDILLQKIELNLIDKTQPKSLTEQIIGYNKEITDLENQTLAASKNIANDTKKINELLELQLSFDKVKEETSSYLKVVHNLLNREVEKAFAPIKLVVEEILEDYFKIDNREVDLVISKKADEIDEETGEVLSEIITAHIAHKNQDISPQSVGKYLNTFHYRLFSTMVSVSIAIASRINTRINLPLVLDDILYASDFENRSTIENFLNEIFKAFKTYTPDMPLQFILFTHDQLIFESAIKIQRTAETGNMTFAKLFSYKEAKAEHNYLNLIYKFPEYFPQTLMSSSIL
jgi:hypothetical protein